MSPIKAKWPLTSHAQLLRHQLWRQHIFRSRSIYMVMLILLIRRLGKNYAASIQFKKQGRETLRARFVGTDRELAAMRAALETQRSIDRTYVLKDSSGTVCATVENLIYIRKQ
jgi:hypothetical protein